MKLKVVMVPADISRQPYTAYISDSLENLQKAVGGYIEAIPIENRTDAVILCDEEGKIKHKLRNPFISQLVGDLVIIGIQNGEFTDLEDSVFWKRKAADGAIGFNF